MTKRGRVIAGAGVATIVIGGTALALSGGEERKLTVQEKRLTGKPTFVVETGGDWSIIRNGPGGIAIGNARSGWEVVGSGRATWGYVLGYVRGTKDFAGCAWIDKRNVKRVGPDRPSGCNWLKFSRAFARRLNCPDCASGTKVNLVRSTGQYANYSKRFGLRDRLRTVPAGRCVEWRWVSKAGGAVMVKDRRHKNPDGSWVFIRRSALPDDLPGGLRGSCPNGWYRKTPKRLAKEAVQSPR